MAINLPDMNLDDETCTVNDLDRLIQRSPVHVPTPLSCPPAPQKRKSLVQPPHRIRTARRLDFDSDSVAKANRLTNKLFDISSDEESPPDLDGDLPSTQSSLHDKVCREKKLTVAIPDRSPSASQADTEPVTPELEQSRKDWICDNCVEENIYHNKTCHTCNELRPDLKQPWIGRDAWTQIAKHYKKITEPVWSFKITELPEIDSTASPTELKLDFYFGDNKIMSYWITSGEHYVGDSAIKMKMHVRRSFEIHQEGYIETPVRQNHLGYVEIQQFYVPFDVLNDLGYIMSKDWDAVVFVHGRNKPCIGKWEQGIYKEKQFDKWIIQAGAHLQHANKERLHILRPAPEK